MFHQDMENAAGISMTRPAAMGFMSPPVGWNSMRFIGIGVETLERQFAKTVFVFFDDTGEQYR